MEKKEKGFVPCKPREMKYHDYLDYWVCDCGNFEKEDGFMACTSEGNLVSPMGARLADASDVVMSSKLKAIRL